MIAGRLLFSLGFGGVWNRKKKQNAGMEGPKGKVYEVDLGIQRRGFTTAGVLSQLSPILNVSVQPDPKATQMPNQVRK